MGDRNKASLPFKSQLVWVALSPTAITDVSPPTPLDSPILGPLLHPLLGARHSLIILLCPLQPLLFPLLPADEDACGGHSGGNDGSDDAPNDATRGPCACCVGGLCKKRDSVRGSPGEEATAPYSQAPSSLSHRPPAHLFSQRQRAFVPLPSPY